MFCQLGGEKIPEPATVLTKGSALLFSLLEFSKRQTTPTVILDQHAHLPSKFN